MQHEIINLSQQYKELVPYENGFEAKLVVYSPDNWEEIDKNRKRPSIVICPGGGYAYTSNRESEPIALHFVGLGYNAFVLHYATGGPKFPAQLLELSAAVAHVRRNAEKYNADKGKVIVCGFSAGGHLAASLGVFWNEQLIRDSLPIEQGENQPNALILCYPVISSGEFSNKVSIENLLGKDASFEKISKMSLENQVNSLVPPVFLWHTDNDAVVPVENALFFAAALKKQKIPLEMHIFSNGKHGLSLCDDRVYGDPSNTNLEARQWLSLCENWLKNLNS